MKDVKSGGSNWHRFHCHSNTVHNAICSITPCIVDDFKSCSSEFYDHIKQEYDMCCRGELIERMWCDGEIDCMELDWIAFPLALPQLTEPSIPSLKQSSASLSKE